MTNREELIKEFDKQNFYETEYRSGEGYVDFEQVKSYIIDTMIKEVFKDLLSDFQNSEGKYVVTTYEAIQKNIKQKAKELYNINL